MFDNISSDKFNVMICAFGSGSGLNTSKEVADVNIESLKTPSSETWYRTKSDYNSPLTFTFSICKKDYSYFIPLERRMISSWLQSKQGTYKTMQFFGLEYSNVIFHAKCTTLEKNVVGGEVVGYNLTFTTNAPYGYTKEQVTNIVMPSSTYSTIVVNTSDEVDSPLYPRLEITINENCNFKMKNNRSGLTFGVTGCTTGEVITVEPEIGYIYSSIRGVNIINNFNGVWFSLTKDIFDMKNSITLTGKANVKLMCSYPRKVGV